MVTDDKVKSDTSVDVYDNVNTRDQNRTGIVLLVLFGLFFAGLVGLGLSHAPGEAPATTENQAPSSAPEKGFDVNRPIGSVELPGTIGKPQKFLSGHGNTPVESGEETAPSTSATATPAAATPAAAPAPAGH